MRQCSVFRMSRHRKGVGLTGFTSCCFFKNFSVICEVHEVNYSSVLLIFNGHDGWSLSPITTVQIKLYIYLYIKSFIFFANNNNLIYCEFLPFTGRPDPPVNLHYNVTTEGKVIFRWSGTQPDSDAINYEIRYSNSLLQQWEVIRLICRSDEYVEMALQSNVCENYVKIYITHMFG